MSLLMDALRKAEQEKKKAEQESLSGKKAEESQEETKAALPDDLSADTLSADTLSGDTQPDELSVDTEPRQLDVADSVSATENQLEVEIEFEESDDLASASIEDERHSSESIKVDEHKTELALEPKPWIDQTPEEISNSQTSPQTEIPQPKEDAYKPESHDSEIQEEESVDRPTRIDEDEQTTDKPAIDLASIPIPSPEELESLKFEPEPATEKSSSTKDQEDKSADETARKTRNRNSAKSVFAAKKSSHNYRRNLQTAAMGIAALLVFGIGLYFYVGIQSNTGIAVNLPDNFDAQTILNRPVSAESDATSIVVDNTPAAVVAIDEGAEESAEENPTDSDSVAEVAVVTTAPSTSPTSTQTDATIDTSSISTSAEVATVSANNTAAQSEVIVATDSSDRVEVVEAVIPPQASSSDLAPVSTVTEVVNTESLSAEQSAAVINEIPVAEIQPVNLISFTRRAEVTTIDPRIADAYIAYQDGDLLTAERLYQQALAELPMHRDALLGLATIATVNEDATRAMDLYSRLLTRNPSDPVARAGMLDLMPAGSPGEQERELKRLMQAHPDVAPLSYALGNFFASQDRWPDAQQAYFRALQLAKSDSFDGTVVNPDYAFNLAISLEHLNQPRPASTYYLEALEFAANHPAGFDLGVVRSRLDSLGGAIQ